MNESNQSPDQRVAWAREYLDAITPYPVSARPRSVLEREDAELRRVLGQVLDVIADYEDAEIDEDLTQILDSGGAQVAPADVLALIVAAASVVSFGESYRGLYLWAHHHGLAGVWAALWPLQVDTFLAVGELALFVGLADRWAPRSRMAAWAVTLAGLLVSVAGNVGHVVGHDLASRATAAVPPLAAAAALAVGLGVLKRVVAHHHQQPAERPPDALPVPVPTDSENAALLALRATHAAGNPLSGRQIETRFGLTRAEATRVRQSVLAESDGHVQEDAPAGT